MEAKEKERQRQTEREGKKGNKQRDVADTPRKPKERQLEGESLYLSTENCI